MTTPMSLGRYTLVATDVWMPDASKLHSSRAS